MLVLATMFVGMTYAAPQNLVRLVPADLSLPPGLRAIPADLSLPPGLRAIPADTIEAHAVHTLQVGSSSFLNQFLVCLLSKVCHGAEAQSVEHPSKGPTGSVQHYGRRCKS